MRERPRFTRPQPGDDMLPALLMFMNQAEDVMDWIAEAVVHVKSPAPPAHCDDCPALKDGMCDCGADELNRKTAGRSGP